MKKIIAAALSILVGAFGYTIVDGSIEGRVSTLESQVWLLQEEIKQYHSMVIATDVVVSNTSHFAGTTEHETTEKTTYPGTVENMLWPTMDNSVIVAGYPTYPSGGSHYGIDICICDENGNLRDSNGNSLSYGMPIYASQSGEVIVADYHKSFGNYCVIDHGNGIQTLYAQAKEIYVTKGDIVKAGDDIGEIGDTGNVTGTHLHFEVRLKKTDGVISRVNPLDYVSAPCF